MIIYCSEFFILFWKFHQPLCCCWWFKMYDVHCIKYQICESIYFGTKELFNFELFFGSICSIQIIQIITSFNNWSVIRNQIANGRWQRYGQATFLLFVFETNHLNESNSKIWISSLATDNGYILGTCLYLLFGIFIFVYFFSNTKRLNFRNIENRLNGLLINSRTVWVHFN